MEHKNAIKHAILETQSAVPTPYTNFVHWFGPHILFYRRDSFLCSTWRCFLTHTFSSTHFSSAIAFFSFQCCGLHVYWEGNWGVAYKAHSSYSHTREDVGQPFPVLRNGCHTPGLERISNRGSPPPPTPSSIEVGFSGTPPAVFNGSSCRVSLLRSVALMWLAPPSY